MTTPLKYSVGYITSHHIALVRLLNGPLSGPTARLPACRLGGFSSKDEYKQRQRGRPDAPRRVKDEFNAFASSELPRNPQSDGKGEGSGGAISDLSASGNEPKPPRAVDPSVPDADIRHQRG